MSLVSRAHRMRIKAPIAVIVLMLSTSCGGDDSSADCRSDGPADRCGTTPAGAVDDSATASALVADLREFEPPSDSTAGDPEVACEDGFGAHAQMGFETTGAEAALLADLRAQAVRLGWNPDPSDALSYERDDHHLSIAPDRTGTRPAALVEVVLSQPC